MIVPFDRNELDVTFNEQKSTFIKGILDKMDKKNIEYVMKKKVTKKDARIQIYVYDPLLRRYVIEYSIGI